MCELFPEDITIGYLAGPWFAIVRVHWAYKTDGLHVHCGESYWGQLPGSIIASRSIYYPTLRADIVEYGMPAYIRRRPIWTCWELRVYVHIPSEGSALNRAGHRDEWIYWEGHRLSRLAQLVEVYYRIENLYTGGVYDSLQLRLEWEWDYEENDWFRVDHI